MAVDEDSFREPGAVPFKWEIRPGVPKQQPIATASPAFSNPFLNPPAAEEPIIRPPPSGPIPVVELDSDPGCLSFRSVGRARSDRWTFPPHRHEAASRRLLPALQNNRRIRNDKKSIRTEAGSEREPDYTSDPDTVLSRLSVSSRKSSGKSYESSPRHLWAGFRLF